MLQDSMENSYKCLQITLHDYIWKPKSKIGLEKSTSISSILQIQQFCNLISGKNWNTAKKLLLGSYLDYIVN